MANTQDNLTINVLADVSSANNNLRKVGQSVSELGNKVAGVTPPTLKTDQALQGMNNRLRDGKGRFIGTGQAANTASQNLDRTARSSRNAGSAAGSAGIKMGGLTTMLKKVARQAMVLAAVYVSLHAAIKTVGGLIAVNASFEDTMQSVKAVVQTSATFTEEKFIAMQAEARRLGEVTRFSANQAAEGLKFLGMAGFDAEQSIASLETTLQLAQAGQLEMGEAADIVSNVMTAFSAEMDQVGTFANALAVTASRSNTDVRQMGEAFRYVGAIAGGMNQDINNVSAAIGVMGSAGVQASMAGTSMRGVLIRLADTNSKTYRSLIQMGASADKINPQLNSMTELMQELKRVGVDSSNAYSLFGARAGVAADILSRNVDVLDELTTNINNSPDGLQKMSDTIEDSLVSSALKLKSAWNELNLTLGEQGIMSRLRVLIDSTTGVIQQMTQAVRVLRAAFDGGELGELLFLSLQVGVIKTVNLFLSSILTAFRIGGRTLTELVKVIATPQFWIGLLQTFAGAGLILLGVAAKFRAALLRTVTPFIAPILGGLTFISDKYRAGMLATAALFIGKFADGLIVIEREGFSGVLDRLKGIFTSIGKVFKAQMLEAVNQILTALKAIPGIAGRVKDVIDANVKAARFARDEAAKAVQGDGSTMGERLRGVADQQREEARRLANKTFQQNTDEAAGFFNGIADSVDKFGDFATELGPKWAGEGLKGLGEAGSQVWAGISEEAAKGMTESNIWGEAGDKATGELAAMWKRLSDQVNANAATAAGEAKKVQVEGFTGVPEDQIQGDGAVGARLGGSVAGAINTILGRSANEIIASEAMKQTAAMKENNDLTRENNTLLKEQLENQQNGPQGATF